MRNLTPEICPFHKTRVPHVSLVFQRDVGYHNSVPAIPVAYRKVRFVDPTSRKKRARCPEFPVRSPRYGRMCAFRKERRIKFAESIKFHRKSGMWGTRRPRKGQAC